MGKVASDKCHKWVFKEPLECDQSISNYWQSSFDALPNEWNEQFDSGIQTIAVIQAGHGLLQLGSCKIVPEDLHFVLKMRHTFESLGYQSGFYLTRLFASTSSASSTGVPLKQLPAPPFKWATQKAMQSPNFQNPTKLGFILSHSSEPQLGNMMGPEYGESDIKWPNGLSFFNALTGSGNDAKLLFNADGLRCKTDGENHQNLNHDKHNPDVGMYNDVMENFFE